MKEFLSHLSPLRWAALGVCALLLAAAYVLRFRLLGYSFSALVCLALAAVIAFYAFFPLLGGRFPRFVPWTTRIVTVVILLGLGVVMVTEGFILHAAFKRPETVPEYVVVLGAKVRPTGPSASLWDRIYAAYDYLLENPQVTAVLSGGQGPDEPMTEAQAMYDQLVDMGIEPQRLLLEDKATSTWENLHFSLDLIEETSGQRPTQLGVLSSEYHLFRASLFTKACGVEFVGIPARTSRVGQTINHFMREVAGVWHYFLLGGQYD